MKSTQKILSCCFALLLAFFFTKTSAQQITKAPSLQADKDIERIELNNVGSPRHIVFSNTAKWRPEDAQEIFSKYLGVTDQYNRLDPAGTTDTKQGSRIDRYTQYFRGIRVEFGGYTVASKGDLVHFISGNFYDTKLGVIVEQSVTEAQARDRAIASTGAQRYIWEEPGMENLLKAETNNPDTSYYPHGNLVWVEDMVSGDNDRKLHLAYAFNVYALTPLSREMVYVDANSGKILFRNSLLDNTVGTGASLYSGTVSFQTTHTASTYSLHDTTRGGGINTYTCSNGTGSVISEVTSGSTTWATDAAIDAHWGAEKVYDYWWNVQGRNSINGTGLPINSYTHLLVNYNNAYWDGTHMTYGDGSGIASGGFSPLVSIDVCAHEIGHGICQYTAGLYYNKESGAMNEGFSDIWGAVIENYADPHETDAVAKDMWKIGEEISASSLRRMDNPNLKNQPDTYGGTYWTVMPGCIPNSGNDYCGVHNNSGVLNYWFYLMCMGGSGTNDIGHGFSVSGIGVSEGADIVYQTELTLAADATFADCRTASINVATMLYGDCSPEVQAVTKAWYAVGVGADYAFGIGGISGPTQVCAGSSVTLVNAGTGGAWTSSNPSAATVGTGTGIVAGVAAGTALITYSVGVGCTTTHVVTINAIPSAITGAAAICAGATTTLGATPTGGTWSSGNLPVATIGSTSGTMTGVAPGSATISYTLATGCRNTTIATVNSVVSIAGTATVCPGATATLTDATAGGTWHSGNTAIATIGLTTGVVSGVSAGTVLMSYTISGSCGSAVTTRVVTVNPLPAAGAITGPSSVCGGFSITLADPVTGGEWSSNDTNKAMVTDGVVTGLLGGVDVISYTYTNSCGSSIATKTITVNVSLVSDLITTIAGNGLYLDAGDGGPATAAGILRPGSMATDLAGNLYITEAVSQIIRKVSATGIITTIAGTGVPGYSGDGGPATAARIYGAHGIAVDHSGNVYFSDGPNIRVRKINTLGIITTFAGNGNDGYSGDGGQATNAKIGEPYGLAVDASNNLYIAEQTNRVRKVTPSGIISTVAGPGVVGVLGDGGPATLASITPYSINVDGSGNLYIADANLNRVRKVNTAGIISTIAGTGVMGFSGDGGPATNAKLNQPTDVDVDSAGNVYISDNHNFRIRKISTSGIMSTVTGTGSPSYNGDNIPVLSAKINFVEMSMIDNEGHLCLVDIDNNRIRKIIPANPLAGIGGPLNTCVGASVTLAYSIAGGTWSSSNTGIATINSISGLLSGVAIGTATITYSINNSCGIVSATAVVTVNPNPSATTGSTSVCVGSTITLSNSTPGGLWFSSGPNATIDPYTGVLTGMLAISWLPISYTLPTGCTALYNVSVNAQPAAITGSPNVCLGGTKTLANTTTGGSWISANPAIAAVGSGTGIVTGVANGTTLITYTMSTGCKSTKSITVVSSLPDIAGSPLACTGTTTTLLDSISGGTWSSGTTAVATVGTSGIVTGVSAGTAVITYSLGATCKKTIISTINASPATITGTNTICLGSNSTLADATSGGTWSSSASGIAAVGASTGIVHGGSSGFATISYTLSTGCRRTMAFTVNTNVTSIAGTASLCHAATTTLAFFPFIGVGSGTWSSGTTSVATVNSTGVVTGLAAGTARISYRVTNSCGLSTATKVVTVTAIPVSGTITGTTSVCVATTATLSDISPGGVWSSSNTAVANVGSATGVVTGIAAGTARITYSVTNSCGAVSATKPITVNPLPSAGTITGTTVLCSATTTTLGNATTGGTWSSSTHTVATINSVGLVTGVAAGTSRISYSKSNSCGTAVATQVVTVNPAADAGSITGAATVCAGAVTTLSVSATGGTWSSSTPSAATVGSSGAVTGVAAGTTRITYTVTNSCGTANAVRLVLVNGLPSAGVITGTATVCSGATTSLTDATSGGTWSSGSTSVATVGSAGIVSGVAGGTAIISYAVSNSCGTNAAAKTVTVNPSPNAGTITGAGALCGGTTTTLSDSVTGGTWSSSTPAVGTINASGLLNGITVGTTTISYSVTNGCGTTRATKVMTVNAAATAGAITGTLTVCAGSTTSLSNATSGGTWSSTTMSAATIGTDGVVSGITAGTSLISYTVSNSCNTAVTTKTVTVNPLADAGTITGTPQVCTGATTTLSNAVSGGTWSSGTPAVATITTSGVVSGVTAGTSIISYSKSNSCGTAVAAQVVTVNLAPAAGVITGTATVCAAAVTTMSISATGGTWSSGTPAVATIGSTGIVAGVSAGTARITYTVTNSCGTANTTKLVTVNGLPSAGTITGTATVCSGTTTSLTDATSGGTWASGSTSIATVAFTGIVSGVTAGTSIISYTVSNSCGTNVAVNTVTVNPSPNAGTITGSGTLCGGTTTTLSNTATGGTWSSSTPAVGTVNASGQVNGISAGTTTISYSVTNSCGTATATKVISVNALATAGTITGTLTVCTGLTTSLGNATGGGTWSSVTMSVATIGTGGIVSGIAAGTSVISYTVTNSCNTTVTTKTVTVNPLADAGTITGTAQVCTGATTTLSNAVSGGTWASGITSVATIGSTGVVSGVAGGTSIISYSKSGSCGTAVATKVVTVNLAPDAGMITGTATVCTGAVTTMSVSATGGSWSSGTPSVATIGSTGIVTGVSAGAARITYAVTNSCGTANATMLVTVNGLPSAGTITGTATVCSGTTTTLANATSGGTWTSGSTSVATVGSTGIVSGVAGGTSIISYTVSNSCGTNVAVTTVTVNPSPIAGTITGAGTLCASASTTLSDIITGGSWSSSAPAVGTISASGIFNGIAAGTATISYSVTNGCGTATATKAISVNALATAGTITGTLTVCAGSTTSLGNATGGGTWSSVSMSVATIGTSGIVSGITAGTSLISYAVTNSCNTAVTTKTVIVNPLADAGTITGLAQVCSGATTTFSNAVSGGTWASGTTSVATIGSTGVVSGVTAGTSIISYSKSGSCGTAVATKMVTVNPAPNAGVITGAATVCAGAVTTMSVSAVGGTWSSSTPSVATAGSSGVVTGVSAGTATITYTVTNSCGTANATLVVTVNGLPSAGTITGTATVCSGATTSLADATSGGSWTSGSTSVAAVGSTGIVTGVVAGTVVISYSVTNGCGTAVATRIATVSTVPSVGSIGGVAVICPAGTVLLSNASSGGTWNSGTASVATVGSTGLVTGVVAGTSVISYSVTNGCGTTTVTGIVTVNPLPVAGTITGTAIVCASATVTLSNASGGGVWSSENASVASIGTSTGLVTGIMAGTSRISYTLTNSCGAAVANLIVTVNPLPDAGTITGTPQTCPGTTTTLGNAVVGGTWSSATTSVATINSAGVVTGINAGTAAISYTVVNSCGAGVAGKMVTVNAMPSAITGANSLCLYTTTTLSDSLAGGTWSSANATIASAGAGTGVITGNSAGSTTITYTSGGGCHVSLTVTVRPLPAAISGPATVCAGSTATYADATTSALSWASRNSSVASIGTSTGVLSGLAAGTTIVTYTLISGCIATTVVSVIPIPSVITGATSVCALNTTVLADADAGGEWSSSPSSVATIGSTTGLVSGMAAGTAIISYTLNGCRTTAYVTVNSIPALITGITSVCVGSVITLACASSGGSWSSSTPDIAGIGTAGAFSALGAGIATINYTFSNGCARSAAVTVSALPVISGASIVCIGNSTTLLASSGGGTWSSSNTSKASVGATTGLLTGIAIGTAKISYTISASCKSGVVVTVATAPPAITGSTTGCGGTTTALSDATPGGLWTSGNTAIAIVGSASGIVTGVTTGSVNITYSTGAACYTVKNIVIGTSMGFVSGPPGLCTGTTGTYISTSPSVGTGWTSSNAAVATVGSISGIVTAVAPGTAIITFTPYSFSPYAGCFGTKIVTVDVTPSLAAITGPASVPIGHTITLANVTPGGVWSSNDSTKVSVSATGVVTGVDLPAAIISYSLTNGACVYPATKTITVTASKAALNGSMNEDASFSLYPNPTSGAFTVRSSGAGVLMMCTLEGKEIWRSDILEGTTAFNVPKDLAAGVYMCRFNGADGNVVMVRLVYE